MPHFVLITKSPEPDVRCSSDPYTHRLKLIYCIRNAILFYNFLIPWLKLGPKNKRDRRWSLPYMEWEWIFMVNYLKTRSRKMDRALILMTISCQANNINIGLYWPERVFACLISINESVRSQHTHQINEFLSTENNAILGGNYEKKVSRRRRGFSSSRRIHPWGPYRWAGSWMDLIQCKWTGGGDASIAGIETRTRSDCEGRSSVGNFKIQHHVPTSYEGL